MTDFSPAAQAVLDAFLAEWLDEDLDQDRCCLAAALRAAADQWKSEIRKQPNTEFISGIKNCIDALNEMADELDELS